MRGDVDALQTENHNYQLENTSLRTQQLQIQQALQAEQATQNGRARAQDEQSHNSSRTSSSDNISALTEMITLLTNDVRDLKNQTATAGASGGGRGRKYIYCWKCGCQLSHWTRQ